MQRTIPAILFVIGIICASTMYFNMLRTIELKSLRHELSAIIARFPSSTQDYISNDNDDFNMDNFNEKIYDMIKQQVGEYLSDIFSEEVKHGHNLVQYNDNDDQTPMSRTNVNYADKLLGASVDEVDAISAATENILTRLGLIANDNSPELMLHFSMKPGDCYAYKDTKAMFTISLTESIRIEAIELQHIPKYMAPLKSTESAPRFFSAFGVNGSNVEHHLGNYEYENRLPYQLFKVNTNVVAQRVRFYFSGNHGHPNFTCIYRIAVYGEPE